MRSKTMLSFSKFVRSYKMYIFRNLFWEEVSFLDEAALAPSIAAPSKTDSAWSGLITSICKTSALVWMNKSLLAKPPHIVATFILYPFLQIMHKMTTSSIYLYYSFYQIDERKIIWHTFVAPARYALFHKLKIERLLKT